MGLQWQRTAGWHKVVPARSQKTHSDISGKFVEVAKLYAGHERTPLLTSKSRYGSLRIARVADQDELALTGDPHASASLA
jgi:hypothetical protein